VLSLLLFLIVISSFYSSIFYAVVAGNVARLERKSEVNRSIKYGNVLSEYFGVYLVVVAFPLIVNAVSGSQPLGYLALVIDLIGFCFYSISGFDLISRPIPHAGSRILFAAVFAMLVAVLQWAQSNGKPDLELVDGLIIVASLLVISAVHVSRGEVQR